MNKPTNETDSLGQQPIDTLDEEIRSLWSKDPKERTDPKVAQHMFEKLKAQIDIINNNPENRKYLEEFVKWQQKSKDKKRDSNTYILEGISKINIKTTTGQSKFANYKERKSLDINNATIDHKGVYKMIELLETNGIVNTTEKEYLEGQNKGDTGITVNEEMYVNSNGVGINNFKASNIRGGLSPFKNAIININSNLEGHEGPTSSTRMVYEILKKMDILSKLPTEDQSTLERFVYFVDFAYRLKQRIYGMDVMYVYGTLFGNYKRLTLQDIWEYLKSNPDKTGFEPLSEEEATKLKILKPKGTAGGKTYETDTMANIVATKQGEIAKAMKMVVEMEEERTLSYAGMPGYKEQVFFFDTGGNTALLEEVAPAREYAFCKLHPNNEIYIRSYYDLPPNFGGFITENGNTIHGKLTEKNIESFLSVFDGDDADDEIKEKIRRKFKENINKTQTPEKKEVKIGDKYQGTVINEKDFGVFVEINTGGHKQSGLLHKSEMKDKKPQQGDTIEVVIKSITADKKISFSLATENERLTIDKIKEGDIFNATISNISEKNLVFVKINNTTISGLLKTEADKENIREIFEKNTPVKVKVFKKSDKGLIFTITIGSKF